MTEPASSRPRALQLQIDECLLRDRSVLRRELAKGGRRKALVQRIDRSRRLVEKRRQQLCAIRYPDLPVTARVPDILKAIEENQVVILAGDTGSGKTTQIPKICLQAGRGIFGRIGHTQPRRLAASVIAHRLAEELGVELGGAVGYQVRFTDKTGDLTLVKMMTDGILLAEIHNDRFLEAYDTIIIDEAHERSLNVDFLLGYLKTILERRADLKVVITSATIDVARFSDHFGGAPVVEVAGRTWPVTLRYRPPVREIASEDADEGISDAIVETLREIRDEKGGGDILVFLPGEREIRDLSREIRKARLDGFELLPLYSRLAASEQSRVFRKHSGRRILLATNVAETSLTVPDIRYVVDPGLARISRYSVRSRVQRLPTEAISRASADQRKGRCGRVRAGVCYRLYDEDDFDSRDEFTTAEILRTNLASVILQMLHLGLGELSRFPFLDRPDPKQVDDGYRLLFELGAVDGERRVTRLGRQIARFPIDPRYARMLLASSRTDCLSELLIICSGLGLQDPRERPFDHQQAADERHRVFQDDRSDFITLLNLWRDFEDRRQLLTRGQLRKHCRRNFLSYVRMREWREIHRQLLLLVKETGLRLNSRPASHGAIHRAILSGLLGHVGQRTDEHEYVGAKGRKRYIFPGSSQFDRKPRWMVAAEIVETSRLYARTVAEIDPAWIEPLAGHLVRRKHLNPFFDPQPGQVLVREEVSLFGLVLDSDRLVDFGAVDPVQARALFITKALVEGELQSAFGFFSHNRRLIRDIEKMESRSRRRDLLVGHEVLYDFYDRHLPDGVCSEVDLARVLEGQKHKHFLYLTREALLQRDATFREEAYPEKVRVDDTWLKLKYRFEPGREDDGARLDIPLAMLRKVSGAELDWMIPGLMREKCLALLKSLPKSLRKHFVPAPDHVDRALEKLEFDGRDLPTAFAERLFRVSGTRVEPGDFNLASLDPHLRLEVRVRDANGAVIASGRDPVALMAELRDRLAAELPPRAARGIERQGAVRWDFGDLPETVRVRQGRIWAEGYVTLMDRGDGVDICVLSDKSRAVSARRAGLLRLYLLHLAEQVKFLRRNIPGFDDFSLYYATRADRQTLADNIVRSAFRAVFIDGRPVVTSQADFEASLPLKSRLYAQLEEIAAILDETLPKAQALQRSLAGDSFRHKSVSLADVRQQMDSLFAGAFPFDVPLDALRQYRRYLKGIEYRLEKLRYRQGRDQAAVERLRPHLKRLEEPGLIPAEHLLRYRWMIEEYRISLFAQALGTRQPVSEKRLEQLWQEISEVVS